MLDHGRCSPDGGTGGEDGRVFDEDCDDESDDEESPHGDASPDGGSRAG